MKKIIFSALACMILSATAFADGGKKGQAKKARAAAEICATEECCPEDCVKTCTDMPLPGCCKK